MAVYNIDPLHSDISFRVKHMMISNVTGFFNKFSATMISDTEDFTDAKIFFECDVDSISTNIQDRDNHLKSDDFFSAEKYPKISFTSTDIIKNGDNYVINGLLKIKDIEKEVSLEAEYGGNDTDLYGQSKFGFEISGTIKRSEFGLTFNLLSGKGNALVSDDVKLIISVQMVLTNENVMEEK